jgi:hypothetical protein
MSRCKVKILLDTDIGSDIDDAVTLAYLLAQARCDLLGITTVSGLPIERAMVASAICNAADLNVPIIPGAENHSTDRFGSQKYPRQRFLRAGLTKQYSAMFQPQNSWLRQSEVIRVRSFYLPWVR